MKTAIIAFILFPLIGLSQKLTISDLTLLCSKKTWSEVNSIITKKGWNYHSSEQGDFESFNEVNWAYDLNMYDDKAKGWVTLYTYEGLPSKISYEVFNKNSFTIIENSIKAAGFKVTTTEILDNQVLAEYANKECYLNISYSTIEDEDDYTSNLTSYSILITKKGSYYDEDNGEKNEYDDDYNLIQTYNLKDGKMNGLSTEFHSNGKVHTKSHWTNGLLNGVFEIYDENGILTERKNYLNGEKNGRLIGYYPSGKINYEVNFVNDLEEGVGLFYNEDGIITSKETFLHGIKTGSFEYINLFTDDFNVEQRILTKGNLLEGEKNGKVFVIDYITKDTIRIQNYLNGKRHGAWTDFENKKVEARYNFSNDLLEGKLIEYVTEGEFTGQIKEESMFSNDKLNGQNKVYFKSFVTSIENGQEKSTLLPVLEIATFKDNKLDGYYSNTEFEIIVEEGFYKNGDKTGKWIESENYYTDSTTETMYYEGNYVKGLKNGVWEGRINDQLIISYTYKDDLMDGVGYIYDEQGYPVEKRIFAKDQITEVSLYDDKKINIIIKIKNRDKNGLYVEFQDVMVDLKILVNFFIPTEFRLDEEYRFIFDKLANLTNMYSTSEDAEMRFREGYFSYENKEFRTEGNYDNNQLNGTHKTFYKNQNVTKILTYDNGIQKTENFVNENNESYSGTLKFIDDNQQFEIKIKKGLRNGSSKITDLKTGALLEEIKYSKGQKKE